MQFGMSEQINMNFGGEVEHKKRIKPLHPGSSVVSTLANYFEIK